MKNILALASVLVCFAVSTPASAQSIWKYFSRPDLAIGMNAYTATTSGSSDGVTYNDNNTIGQYSIMADVNLPIVELFDHATAGFSPGLSLGMSPSNGESLRYSTQSANLSVPLFATVKWDNDATWKGNDGMAFGASAGFGYIYHMFTYLGQDGGNGHSFGSPSYMVELNLGERHSSFGILKLRYIGAIGSGFSSTSNGITETLNNPTSVYLVMTMGY